MFSIVLTPVDQQPLAIPLPGQFVVVRLRALETGERDRGVLDAIRYHTVGSAGWDDVGKMLYLADFLEPGRGTIDLTEMAQRVPEEKDAVLQEVARRRIEWVLRSGWRLPAETVAFWNKLTAHQ